MKRILIFSLVSLLTLFSFQQLKAFDFTVSGQVLETELLTGVANQQVKLHIHQTGIFENVLTADDGTYSITVAVPDSGSFSYVVKTFDHCTHHYVIKEGVVLPEGATQNFVICENGSGQADCEADFDWHKSMHTPYKVKFQDKSDFQAGSWAWEFGDGQVSDERNPEHVYAAAGDYTVTLTINSADSSCVDAYSETVTLDTIVFGCDAAFEYNASWHNPMKIYFHDESDFLPGNWHWDFGDGESSTSRNPQHTYSTGGDFTVTLTIASADSSCTDSFSETLTIEDLTMNCEANFWWHHNHPGNNPLEKKFKDNSYTFSPVSTYTWNFGDGTSSSEENPVHVFSNFGLYNVSLNILTESGCSSSKSIPVLVIDPTQECAAMFVPVIDTINPLQVTFNDLSLGGADGWTYEFGDGTTSNEQNPVHIFPGAEVYITSLSITAGSCTSSFYYEIDLVNGKVFAIPGGVTGVSNETAAQISFFPNPVENLLSVNAFGNKVSEIRIVNLAGQTLIISNETNINVSDLPKGLYFVAVLINDKLINSKFIKK